MAELRIPNELHHALERAIERFHIAPKQARTMLAEVCAAITEQSPQDWRFTASPAAVFMICYEPDTIGCRFIGRTFRDRNEEGRKLIQRLQIKTVSGEKLITCAQAYRQLILSPDCAVFHEMKTCYRGPMDLSEEKRLFARTKELVGHLVLLDEKRIALRPNALVTGGQLWARQGEFFDPSAADGDYREYLLFERLTSDGIDKSRHRIYSVNRQGHIRLEGEGGSASVRSPAWARASNLRSQSYWMLPTFVDVRYADLQYARRAWKGDDGERLDAQDLLLLARIEKLQELLGRRAVQP
jgi:hypothetical protein